MGNTLTQEDYFIDVKPPAITISDSEPSYRYVERDSSNFLDNEHIGELISNLKPRLSQVLKDEEEYFEIKVNTLVLIFPTRKAILACNTDNLRIETNDYNQALDKFPQLSSQINIAKRNNNFYHIIFATPHELEDSGILKSTIAHIY